MADPLLKLLYGLFPAPRSIMRILDKYPVCLNKYEFANRKSEEAALKRPIL